MTRRPTRPSDEGELEAASTSARSPTRASNDGPWTVNVNWGDGSPHTTFTRATQGTLGTQTHTYADNGTYTVTVTVTDKDGGSRLGHVHGHGRERRAGR